MPYSTYIKLLTGCVIEIHLILFDYFYVMTYVPDVSYVVQNNFTTTCPAHAWIGR